MSVPYFFKREAKLALNSVNSGSLQYAVATESDYNLYSVGQALQIVDQYDNPVMEGYIIDKSRSSVNVVTLYLEDAGKFLRDYNVEDNAPEDGEPVCCTVRTLLQSYILPATWGLDTSSLAIYDEYEAKLDWVIRYAVRNGTSLKHVNNLCDMMRMRWVAKWKSGLQRFDLCLYPIEFSNTGSISGLTDTKTIKELENTTSFNAVDSVRHFVTSIQTLGSEHEAGQYTSYCQKDYTGATSPDDPYTDWGYGYLLSSDTYCNSLDVLAGVTYIDIRDSDVISGWATDCASHFQFNQDSAYYGYDTFDGASVRNIVSYPDAPWKYLDPATIASAGLAVAHATNDEMYLNDIMVDRRIVFGATTWAWIGGEVISFNSIEYSSPGTARPEIALLKGVTRGLNGVRYIHRAGALIRPYFDEPPTTSLLYSVGTLSVTISAPGFTELDGLDKFSEGILGSAVMRYSGKTERTAATVSNADWYPGMWVNTIPASVAGATIYTDTPPVTMIKSVSYSLGKLVSIEFGTNIPEVIRSVKEGVTALDLAIQKTPQSVSGEVTEYSANKSCALMKVAKSTKERSRSSADFDESDEANYISRWVRVK